MEYILQRARQEHFAVGAFNVNTFDEMVAIAETAQRLQLPVMMMASMSAAKFFGCDTFASLCRTLNRQYSIPIYSHLDHCTDPALLLACVEAGFQSVMYDGSHETYENNVSKSAELAGICHKNNVYIEAELGVIEGAEGPVKSAYSVFTNPDYVEDFVHRTTVDSLAISIGNAHGIYKGKPKLQFDLLHIIAEKLPQMPLVLHGGTGIPADDLRRAVQMGISKVNVGTELRHAYMDGLHSYAASHLNGGDVREFVCHLRTTVGSTAEKYMSCFDCRSV